MQEYSLADIRRLFGLTPALTRKLGQVGCITHTVRRKTCAYTFQDLVVLRLASALNAAKIPSPKIVAALRHIQTVLPPGREFSTIALAASGKSLVVHEGPREWEASGQYTLPLAANEKVGQLSSLKRPGQPTPDSARADDHYRRGQMLEDTDVAAARAAYIAALDLEANHLEARINLGRLLHLEGQLKTAERVYRQAKSPNAVLSFNLAVVLEDLDRTEEAIAAYHQALALDPLLHDAHFNLSRLYELVHRPRDALKHLLAYQRHISRYGE
jgi:tetratricopeptide (TPR) repeat protein